MITYFITRDSDGFGNLEPYVDVWSRKPRREKLTIDHGHVWLPSDSTDSADLGHVGQYPIKDATQRYGTIPETDLELVRILVCAK